jgi:hypothetical protein
MTSPILVLELERLRFCVSSIFTPSLSKRIIELRNQNLSLRKAARLKCHCLLDSTVRGRRIDDGYDYPGARFDAATLGLVQGQEAAVEERSRLFVRRDEIESVAI